MPGPVGVWATLLPLLERIGRDPMGARLEAFGPEGAELVEYARDLVASGRALELVRTPVDEAVTSLWPDLVALTDSVP